MAGEADITKVEISTDNGATWNPARLGRDQAHYAWRLWTYDWKAAKPGAYTILSRATDSQLRTQPSTPVWNPSGYLYNAVENGAPVQRSLHVGKRAQRKYGELEYGVWQKQEAMDIMDQLTRAGFKRSTSSAPDMGLGNSAVSMSFRKGKNSLS